MSSSVLFSERRNTAQVHSFRNASNLEFMRIESGTVSFASNVSIEQLKVNGTIVASQVSGNATGLTGVPTGALVGTLTLAQGGTGSNLTPSNGGIFYSTATAAAVLPGTAFEGRMLQSGSTVSPTPKWSTPTYPTAASGTAGTILRSDGTNIAYTATTWPTTLAANNILFTSGNNTIAGIAPVTSSVLTTNTNSIPTYIQGTTANRILRTDGQNITFDRLDISTDVKGSTAGKLLVGSTATAGAVDMPTLLHWDSTNSRLGIGTASPTQQLHVQGNILANGTIRGSSVQFDSIGVGTAASGIAGEVKATSFVGSGASITQLNAGNIATGTLAVARGGTGLQTLTANKILVGNGTNVEVPTNLHWDIANSRLGIGTATPTVALSVVGDIKLTGSIISPSSTSAANTVVAVVVVAPAPNKNLVYICSNNNGAYADFKDSATPTVTLTTVSITPKTINNRLEVEFFTAFQNPGNGLFIRLTRSTDNGVTFTNLNAGGQNDGTGATNGCWTTISASGALGLVFVDTAASLNTHTYKLQGFTSISGNSTIVGFGVVHRWKVTEIQT